MSRSRIDLEYAAFYPVIVSATISSGGNLSGAIDLNGLSLVAIIMPSAFDGTTLTFQASHNGTNWFELHDAAGNAITVTVGANRYIQLDWQRFLGIRYIRIRSGTASSPVNQTAARTLHLVTRAIK